MAAVHYEHPQFSVERDLELCQFDLERACVDRFKKSRPECAMHSNGCAENCVGKLLVFERHAS